MGASAAPRSVRLRLLSATRHSAILRSGNPPYCCSAKFTSWTSLFRSVDWARSARPSRASSSQAGHGADGQALDGPGERHRSLRQPVSRPCTAGICRKAPR
ncbi:hypothetical protein DBB29_09650 [Pandoraea cepalis]|uniref:Uncharacterized protein n=1 Tax=Pandoraea cepalis TaxID=2508294 RepID=A0AAW7MHA1_9BURK|nr:hypothetical protein [Pandoraea cepalis]MDN4578378.1 hypothetical protein [Pandoraea cepalis]